MVIYAELQGNRIFQWSASPVNGYLEIEVPDDHPILTSLDNTIYDYIGGKVIGANDKYLLDELKKSKSEEMSRICGERIVRGFEYILKNLTYHFSYDTEAQVNFQETYLLFTNGVIEEVNWTVMNDSGEKIRIKLGKEDFQKVYFESINHKLGTISHYRDTLVPMIKATRTKEELEQIDWGMTPAGDHLVVSPEKALDKKVGTISEEVNAQKQVNMQMETIILDVADLALSSMYS